MRVVHIARHGLLGGLETITRGLYAGLEAHGHANTVVAVGTEIAGLAQQGRQVRWAPELLVDDPAVEATAAERIEGLIGAIQPDVVSVHTMIRSRIAERLLGRVPTVYFAHEYGLFCPSGARLFERSDRVCDLRGVPDWRCLANAYLQRCNTRRPGRLWGTYARSRELGAWVRRADAIVCGSGYVAERCAENGFPLERLHALNYPVCIPTPPVPPAAAREPLVLFAGRVMPQKGLDYLLRAMALIATPCTLVVAGEGHELPRQRALATELGLGNRVSFRPDIVGPGLHALYARAAAVVVPSVWPEPFGLVGPEAMSFGTPVVAFRVGGIPEWLDHGETGFLVEPRDVRGLAERIESLLRDAVLAQRLGSRGREVAQERFSLDGYVDRVVRVFDAVRSCGARP